LVGKTSGQLYPVLPWAIGYNLGKAGKR